MAIVAMLRLSGPTNEQQVSTSQRFLKTNGCESDVQSAETQIETFLIAPLQNPAPSALSSQSDRCRLIWLRQTHLLAIIDALMRGDSAKVDAGETSFAAAIRAADVDAQAAANP